MLILRFILYAVIDEAEINRIYTLILHRNNVFYHLILYSVVSSDVRFILYAVIDEAEIYKVCKTLHRETYRYYVFHHLILYHVDSPNLRFILYAVIDEAEINMG